ncbi:MAG: toxin [Burkholderiales bacterium]|nr:toxin [Burkholderiales bacterium]
MRFVIVGTSGSGKSTFGRRLADATGSPFIELDALHWAPGWVERPDDEFAASVDAATTGERWVADGNYSVVRQVLWPKATHVVWLNFSRTVVMSRVTWRTLRRWLRREDLWHGNRESFARSFLSRDSVLLWAATTFDKNQRKYQALSDGPDYGHLAWAEFTKPSQADAFLEGLQPVTMASSASSTNT